VEGKLKYAIFGANGAVGKELAKVLHEEKQEFRVVGRSEKQLRATFSKFEPYVQYCEADLSKTEGAMRASQGVDTVFYVVGVPYDQFALHPKISKVCTEAAAQSGVKRFVHLSTLYPYGRMQGSRVTESHPREPHTFKGKMRKEQEDVVMSAHGRSGMQVTILCPPDFYGGQSDLSLVYRVFAAALNGGKADVFAPIDKPHEFVFVPDLARTLYELSKREEAYGRRFNLAGYGAISTREFAEKVFTQVGQKPRLRIAGPLLLRIAGLFSPFMREFQEMHYLLTDPLFVDDSALQKLLPNLKKTSYDEGIRLTIARMKQESKATQLG
jgi:nucleoside-diphosphate-sugar epimerase